jgi:hypothetical protein
MTRMLAFVALAFSCTAEHDVLVADPQITTCDQALLGQTGQACAFSGTCANDDAAAPTCCGTIATCNDGALAIDSDCASTCVTCANDTGCANGTQICAGTVCIVCPPTEACSPCPANEVQLERNGCPTCDCAPPATCMMTTTSASLCTGSDKCYKGADCTSGCTPADPGCCSDQCAAMGCTGPIPVGCLAPCTGSAASCTTCAADHCDCVAGAWQCTIACAEGAHASCVAP